VSGNLVILFNDAAVLKAASLSSLKLHDSQHWNSGPSLGSAIVMENGAETLGIKSVLQFLTLKGTLGAVVLWLQK
jgi:hypothetical protein